MKYIVALFLVLSIQSIQGQNKAKIDSLQRVYQTAIPDTIRILSLVKIASLYYKTNPDTCIQLAEKALKLSQNIVYKKGESKSLYTIALGALVKSDFDKSLSYSQKALTIGKEINNINVTAEMLKHIGTTYYYKSDYKSAMKYFKKSLEKFRIINNKNKIADLLNAIGAVHWFFGELTEALEYTLESLKIKEEMGDKHGMYRSLISIGNIYYTLKKYELSLEYYQRVVKIAKELNLQNQVASTMSSIGLTYKELGKYDTALEYLFQSLELDTQLGTKGAKVHSLCFIGETYEKTKKYDLALEYYQKSIQVGKKYNNNEQMPTALQGIARVYQMQGQYDKSIEYALRSIRISQENGHLLASNTIYETLYASYKLKGDYVNALKYHELYKQSNDSLFNADKNQAMADLESRAEVERKENEITILNKDKALLEKDNKLQHIEAERQKNAKLALEKQAEADQLMALARQEKDKRKQDSLQSLAQKTQLEADKLKAHEKQLEAESKARKLEAIKEREAKEFQQYINYLVIVGLLSLVIFAFFIYRSRQKERNAKNQIQSQKEELQEQQQAIQTQNTELKQQKEELQIMNEELHQQSEEILMQRDYIEEQNQNLGKVNKMLTGNIKVAKTIQDAVLPYEDKFQNFFQEYFIFNKPRDIVSGDFYWLEQVENQIFLVVADATGHGVSGGFMAMIGSMMLDRIIVNYKILDPAQILTHLHQEIRKALKQDISHNQSGMDLSLVRITPHKEAFEVCFAGAKNDLLYFDTKAQKIQVIKASRKSIGGEQNEEKIFQKEKLLLPQNTILYVGSDGLEDQNDLSRKKIGRSNLVKLLEDNMTKSLDTQSQKLEESLERHMKDTEQRDDILWLGVKL